MAQVLPLQGSQSRSGQTFKERLHHVVCGLHEEVGHALGLADPYTNHGVKEGLAEVMSSLEKRAERATDQDHRGRCVCLVKGFGLDLEGRGMM